MKARCRENLIYCTENVSDEKMIAACKAVGLDHFIRTLPKGYDTVVGDQLSLSQGQKQQLTIARAMIADKPMLILDEATSSVDHTHRAADPVGDGQAHGKPHLLCHRPPPVDHS